LKNVFCFFFFLFPVCCAAENRWEKHWEIFLEDRRRSSESFFNLASPCDSKLHEWPGHLRDLLRVLSRPGIRHPRRDIS
jgi:hypothetical protein